jgi:hypothetical protein
MFASSGLRSACHGNRTIAGPPSEAKRDLMFKDYAMIAKTRRASQEFRFSDFPSCDPLSYCSPCAMVRLLGATDALLTSASKVALIWAHSITKPVP